MAKTIAQVNVGDLFSVWLTKTNLVINALATEVITANTNANGAVNSGNLYMSGIVFSNTLCTAGLRGGNVQSAANLAIISNATVNGVMMATSFVVGANLILNATSVFLGNSTVNVSANSSVLNAPTVKAATVNATTGTITLFNSNSIIANTANIGNINMGNILSVGNSSVNATMNATAFAIANASGTFVVTIGDGVSNTFFNDKFKFQNNFVTTGVSAQTIDFYPLATYRATEYLISCKDNASNNAMITKLLCTHDGVNAYTTEYGEIYSASDLGFFSATTNASHVLMQFTPTINNISVTIARTQLGV